MCTVPSFWFVVNLGLLIGQTPRHLYLYVVVVVRPSRAMMTLTSTYKLGDWVRWVLRWLIRPILALKDRPHVEQTSEESIKPDIDELAALDLYKINHWICTYQMADVVHFIKANIVAYATGYYCKLCIKLEKSDWLMNSLKSAFVFPSATLCREYSKMVLYNTVVSVCVI